MTKAADIPEQAATVTETAGLRYLNPTKLRFFRRGGSIYLLLEGDACYIKVSVLRSFPLSDASHYLSIRDQKNDEIGLVTNPDSLDESNRQIVAEELRRRYILPVIRRIFGVKERFGTIEWRVETDRGECVFTTRNLHDNVFRPAKNRILLTDVDGNRFDVPDLTALPFASQAHLLRHL